MPTTGSLPVFLAAATAFSSRENDAIGAKRAGQAVLVGKIRVCARARSYDHVAQLQRGSYAARRAYADNIVHIVEIEKLIGVDAHRRHTHTGSHNRDGLAVICSGIALNASDIVYETGVVEKSFGDILCS